MSKLETRIAEPRDIDRLVELNSAAYPELVAEGVVFDRAQITAHLAVFGEGQIVADLDGHVVGAIATLIVRSPAVLAPHTWETATSLGTFASHDAGGDCLYLADIYSDPTAARIGIGRCLYEALFALCRAKRLARVVAGGRLWGYHEVASQLSPDDYVASVVAKRRKDRVLDSQLRAGFTVKGILPGYLDDWRSGSFATHLVWENPDVKPAGTGTRVKSSNLVV